jgi:hypothetical protein
MLHCNRILPLPAVKITEGIMRGRQALLITRGFKKLYGTFKKAKRLLGVALA